MLQSGHHFLAAFPKICRLHPKAPRVMNLDSHGASTLGWTSYTTAVLAREASSDHAFSCHLETGSIADRSPHLCLYVPRDGRLSLPCDRLNGNNGESSKELRLVSSVVTWFMSAPSTPTPTPPPYGQDQIIHPVSFPFLKQASYRGLTVLPQTRRKGSLFCLKTLLLLF